MITVTEKAADEVRRIISEQGLEMGRPSRVSIEVECEGQRIVSVRVGGSAVVVGEGQLGF